MMSFGRGFGIASDASLPAVPTGGHRFQDQLDQQQHRPRRSQRTAAPLTPSAAQLPSVASSVGRPGRADSFTELDSPPQLACSPLGDGTVLLPGITDHQRPPSRGSAAAERIMSALSKAGGGLAGEGPFVVGQLALAKDWWPSPQWSEDPRDSVASGFGVLGRGMRDDAAFAPHVGSPGSAGSGRDPEQVALLSPCRNNTQGRADEVATPCSTDDHGFSPRRRRDRLGDGDIYASLGPGFDARSGAGSSGSDGPEFDWRCPVVNTTNTLGARGACDALDAFVPTIVSDAGSNDGDRFHDAFGRSATCREGAACQGDFGGSSGGSGPDHEYHKRGGGGGDDEPAFTHGQLLE